MQLVFLYHSRFIAPRRLDACTVHHLTPSYEFTDVYLCSWTGSRLQPKLTDRQFHEKMRTPLQILWEDVCYEKDRLGSGVLTILERV